MRGRGGAGVGTAAMAVTQPTPTIQAQGFMISSSDINDSDTDSDSPASARRNLGPRPATPRFLPVSPPDSVTSGHGNHSDVTYDLSDSLAVPAANQDGLLTRAEGHNLANDGDPSRPVQNGGAEFYDSQYVNGRRASPNRNVSRYTAEAKAIINDEIDARAAERDLQDNIAAQAEIARELAQPWCSDFPAHCIPRDNYQLWDLVDERDTIERDLNYLSGNVALDGTLLDPNIDRDDEVNVLSDRYNNINRAMYTIFANTLQETALSVTSRASRKRRASSDLAPPTPSENIAHDATDPCPYEHARTQVPTTTTVPVFEPLPDLPFPEPSEPKQDNPDGKDLCFFSTIWAPDTYQHCIRKTTTPTDKNLLPNLAEYCTTYNGLTPP
jgi:hypothetical protein